MRLRDRPGAHGRVPHLPQVDNTQVGKLVGYRIIIIASRSAPYGELNTLIHVSATRMSTA